MKKALNKELQKYISQHPEFRQVLDIFGETLETYEKALEAMGASPAFKIGNSSTLNEDLITSNSSLTQRLKTGS